MHVLSEPPILYLGTPVVLVSTINPDGTPNLAPMSSAFWLGWRCMIGPAAASQTPQNLIRTRECVLNLPSVDLVSQVDRLALTTGTPEVPDSKAKRGYRHVADKFDRAGLTPMPSETIAAPRVRECPVQLEAVLEGTHRLYGDDPALHGRVLCLELRITRVHVDDALLVDEEVNRIDPDKWRPLMMSFQNFYGLGERIHPSTLATIPETLYLTPDVARARAMA
jgi:flavin reductase (DIM6/NTAB) family NADH-FMN oxidoreductase RutF